MLDNGQSLQTQTATLTEPSDQSIETISDLTCIAQCNELVNQYRLNQNGKANSILAIREVLLKSEAVRSSRNPTEALDVFVGILDNIDFARSQASERGQQTNNQITEEDAQRTSALASLPEDIRATYKQLENFAIDPKSVVSNILSTPGCPPFPLSEWLNVVHWKYVDLGKVLDSVYTTELDPKKTHVIMDNIHDLANGL
ncbi:uncharacterized protein EDB93DRAFT_1106808 [Suillus bovinus]|uniref:uncharacterized protein n=1 Tax=Suillus bovinus TaxID=48563 RepID=UPI001B872701|nr:uncharacterized protein EDB93DRAFT_1106808 [Suillus bovinus]KAG2136604.1 hypothetical protein EDB93DRAFT_1106808 [Suillus bovinus]